MIVVCNKCGHVLDNDWNEYCPKCDWAIEKYGYDSEWDNVCEPGDSDA